MLNCGHSFCEQCLELLFKSGQVATPGNLTCPSCLTVHPFPLGIADLKKLIKNFTLLSLAETSKTPASHTPRGGGSTSNRAAAKSALGFHRLSGKNSSGGLESEERKSDVDSKVSP